MGQRAEAVFKVFPGRTFQGTVAGLYFSSPDAEYALDGETPEPLIYEPIFEALKDDLNTPKAFAQLSALLKSDMDEDTKKQHIIWVLEVLGIPQIEAVAKINVDEDKINELIEARKQAKADKDFVRSDAIRDELLGMGIVIKDTREGTLWEKAS